MEAPLLTLFVIVVFVVGPSAQFHVHAVADDRGARVRRLRPREVFPVALLVVFPVLLRVRLSVGDGVVVGGGGVLDGFLFRLGFPAEHLVLDVPEERPDPDEGDLSLVGLGVLFLGAWGPNDDFF